jgi:DNA-nicking Smr family endonuclease
LTNNISDKDKKDWENFISKKEKLPNKDHKIDKKITFKIKSIDLHGYTLEEANKTIEEFINNSYREKINKLIVVTGKGIHSQNEKDPLCFKRFKYFKIFSS